MNDEESQHISPRHPAAKTNDTPSPPSPKPSKISRIITFLKKVYSPPIIVLTIFQTGGFDYWLNPYLLSAAKSGYKMQSQTLYIPDQNGYFAPGPETLQIHQGRLFLMLVLSWWSTGLLLAILALSEQFRT